MTQNANFPPIQLDSRWSWLCCLSAVQAVQHAEAAVHSAEAAVHSAESAVLAAACEFGIGEPSWRRTEQRGQQAALERWL